MPHSLRGREFLSLSFILLKTKYMNEHCKNITPNFKWEETSFKEHKA